MPGGLMLILDWFKAMRGWWKKAQVFPHDHLHPSSSVYFQCVVTFKDRSLDLIAPHAHGIAALMLASARNPLAYPPCIGYKALEITRLQVVCGLGKLPLPAHPFSKIIHVPDAAAEKSV